jgi:Protein of unknown function (DUF992)
MARYRDKDGEISRIRRGFYSVALQPLSVQGQVGLNAAGGIGALDLHYAQRRLEPIGGSIRPGLYISREAAIECLRTALRRA